MDWFVLFLVAGAGIAIWRIVYQVRRASQRREDDWDAKLIERLRRSGVDPFSPVEVDFFVALPTRASANAVAAKLRTEGFATDVRELPDGGEQPWSVYAMRSMQLNANGVREVSNRMRALAAETGGRYDGWAPGPGKPVA